jgi:2-amino-4-hydroxy-6-hydroxymethyldihydropteridine diphosphokinase
MTAAEPLAYIGLGGNMPSPGYGLPRATLAAAIEALSDAGLSHIRRSRWYWSAPIPSSDQPLFINAVVSVRPNRSPGALLELLHRIEHQFGRIRTVPNAARVLDLDLLAVDDLVFGQPGGLTLPHPRLHQRAFVLKPWAELAPQWRHPILGRTIAEMIARLPAEQQAEPMAERFPDPESDRASMLHPLLRRS